jgi:protein AbiQ
VRRNIFSPFRFKGGKQMSLTICSIDSRYIHYLRSDPKLQNVYENKDGPTSHGRKYLGIVLQILTYPYYVPLSSPKKSDYDPTGRIRKDIIPIMRIIAENESGNPELKGTLRFSNMIPVPDCAIIPYDIHLERDLNYKIIVEKEYRFIRSNQKRIYKNAEIIYRQKTVEDAFYIGKKKPDYLSSTVDFLYAEIKCSLYRAPAMIE